MLRAKQNRDNWWVELIHGCKMSLDGFYSVSPSLTVSIYSENSLDGHIHSSIHSFLFLTFASLAATLGTFGRDFVVFYLYFIVFHFFSIYEDVFPMFCCLLENALRRSKRGCIATHQAKGWRFSMSLDWIKSIECKLKGTSLYVTWYDTRYI